MKLGVSITVKRKARRMRVFVLFFFVFFSPFL